MDEVIIEYYNGKHVKGLVIKSTKDILNIFNDNYKKVKSK